MPWKKNSRDHNEHAFLSPSNYHWMNYSVEKLKEVYRIARLAKVRGTKLHALAAELIDCGVELPKKKKTLNMYVNDAIRYKMEPEVSLWYSPYCFGTADALRLSDDVLRIHDLKTGKTPASFKQLLGYASIYFLQNDIRPGDVETELRIYQSNERIVTTPPIEDIVELMDKIVLFSDILQKIDEEEDDYDIF